MDELAGMVGIVTGGAGVIGRGTARAFLKEGASVVITGRTQSTLDETVAALETIPGTEGKVLAVRADGAVDADVKNAVDQTIERFGRLDILVQPAQVVIRMTPIEELTMADMYISYETGVFATFRYMQACLPHLKKTAGTIVNYCSNSGMSSEPGSCAYGSNKEAIRGLSRTAGKEWGQYGITVNCIKPVVIDEHFGHYDDKHEQLMQKTLSEVPLGRSGDPELDCGRLCVYLATKGKYLTGHTFSEDGGRVMYPG